jgi:hypothetical protein
VLRWLLPGGLVETSQIRGIASAGDLLPSLERMLASKELEIQVRALRLADPWDANPLAGWIYESLSDRG